MTYLIPLGKGLVAQVDSEDYADLVKYHWYARRSKSGWYAVRKATIHGIRRTIFMHRQLAGADANHQVHHINHNRLDNRRANLQIVTRQEHSCIHQANRITRPQRVASHSKIPPPI